MRIPQSWKDITIRQFLAANEALQATYDDKVDQSIALVSAVTGASEKDILSLPRKELIQIVEQLSFLNTVDSISTKWPKWFMIQGRLFKPVQKLDNLTAGQYIDLMAFSKEPMENIHKVLATLCLPCTWYLKAKKYDGAKHQEIAQFFLDNLTMDIAYPIAVFFCKVWENSLPAILDFLEREILKMTNSGIETASLNTTAGFTHLTNSPAETRVNGTSLKQ